jgi:hypothetical protein
MESPGAIKDQGRPGDRFDEGQADGDHGKESLRDEIISGDGCSEGLGIEKFGDPAIDEEARQGDADNQIGPGMNQPLSE